MVNEHPKQFGGPSRFGAASKHGTARTQASATLAASPAASRSNKLGLGPGKGGKGLGKGGLKRHMKVQRDTIYGVTKGDIRRLARRGGIKRISAGIYDDVRQALRERLALIMKDACAIVEHNGRRTITVTDIVFTLRRLGNPLYGFDPSFLNHR
ncbi:histone-fold-containing protein [Clathrospora elynae]|uniref:Histone H4 n=1 Tax=Clathrospora elynae TaxID=706981 RepID=A0A6A5SEK7_9PLEO|nr:histone-fold-containing protein [Clathrospora elynae]